MNAYMGGTGRVHDSYARTHGGSQCVLIWYTHLIAAAGTQLHHVPGSLLLNQVVSYHPVCTNKNSTCGCDDMHTSTGVDLGIK